MKKTKLHVGCMTSIIREIHMEQRGYGVLFYGYVGLFCRTGRSLFVTKTCTAATTNNVNMVCCFMVMYVSHVCDM